MSESRQTVKNAPLGTRKDFGAEEGKALSTWRRMYYFYLFFLLHEKIVNPELQQRHSELITRLWPYSGTHGHHRRSDGCPIAPNP